MRKPLLAVLIAIIVIVAATAVLLYQKYTKTNSELMEARSGELSAQSRYTDAIGAIAEIQDSLAAISVGGPGADLKSGMLTSEQKLSGPSSREALDRIHLLSASIQRTKAKINDLEAKLKKSNVKVAGLEKMIVRLKSSLSEKESVIAQLTGKVDSLNTQVAGLQTTVAEANHTIATKDMTIEEKRRELSTIYYIVGSKKKLMDAGLLVAKGGVLGLGKTLQASGNFDENGFTGLDTDKDTKIPIGTLKAQVVSGQPASSYKIVPANGHLELQITDVKEFRKFKQLVIMTL